MQTWNLNLIERITSQQNPRIKKTIRLHSSRGRQTQGRIIVFGTREVDRALDSGIVFEELYFADSESDELVGSFESRTAEKSTCLIRLDDDVFEKIAYGDRIGGVVGVASRPATELDNIELGNDGEQSSALVMIVQTIENQATLARSSARRTLWSCGCDLRGPVNRCLPPKLDSGEHGHCFQCRVGNRLIESDSRLAPQKQVPRVHCSIG